MTIADVILAKLRQLSVNDQQRILDAVNKLPPAEATDNGSSTNGEELPAKPSIWAKLQALGQASEEMPCDLPADLAANLKRKV